MKKINRGIMMFLCLVIFLTGLHLLDTYVLPQPEGNEEEMEYSSHHVAPDFTVCDRDGHDVRLASFYPKPMVVLFWASWDTTSQEVLPAFQEMYPEYGERVQFILVDVTDGSKETRETAEEYLKEKAYDFPVYYDIYGSAKEAYGTRAIPAAYFINSDFELIARANGTLSREALEQGLKMAIDPETDQTE